MAQHQLIIHQLSDLEKAAKELLEICRNKKFFAFYGKPGAGKTTFIKTLCRELGSTDNVTSPTYALVNEYVAPGHKIYHMDLYRLNRLEEALDIGIEEYFADADAYCLVEWPDLAESILPEDAVKIYMEQQADDSRLLNINLWQ